MQKLRRRPQRFEGISVGLDLHKKFTQYSVLDQAGDELANERLASREQALIGLIDQLEAEHGAVQVAIEASGCFLWAYDVLVERLGHGRVQVAAPSKVTVIAQSQQKTDANDAWWLAYLLWEGRLPQAYVAQGDLRELRIACREFRSVTDERSDLMRRMGSHLRQLGLSVRSNDWSSAIGWERIGEAVDRAAEHGMRGVAVGRLWRRIQQLTEERAYWQRQCDRLSAKFDAIAQLDQQLPGVGKVIAATVYAELGDPARYRSAKAYAKATGLTPGYRESAGRRRQGKVTREGSAHVRWALTRAVRACMRCKHGPGLAVKAWVHRMSRRKTTKAATVAAARKLAEGIWRLFAYGEAFDVSQAFGGERMIAAGARLE